MEHTLDIALTVNGETFTVDIWSISREEWEKRNPA